MAILGVLASMVLPLCEVTVKRNKELELRRSLQTIREAIDHYKDDFERARSDKKIIVNVDDSGYPPTLDDLVSGVEWGGLYPYPKKYLRRIPVDPFDSNRKGWGLRSYVDEPGSTFWGGQDVYDVYCQSKAEALDGSRYQDW